MNTPAPSFFTSFEADTALLEVKFHAKKLLKSCLAQDPNALAQIKAFCDKLNLEPTELQLKHCQLFIARQIGFTDFNQCQRVLSGKALLGEDLGGLFHFRRCDTLLNHWFTNVDEAKDYCLANSGSLLLPFKKQFFVVNRADYLGLLDRQGDDGLDINQSTLLQKRHLPPELALELVKYKLKSM